MTQERVPAQNASGNSDVVIRDWRCRISMTVGDVFAIKTGLINGQETGGSDDTWSAGI
jgi:hypothetical protein